MTRKSVFYALAVAVLMGSMAGVALADYNWAAGAYAPDPSVSSQSKMDMDQSAAEIREPVETGAIPESSESLDRFKESTGETPSVELGGRVYRPGIDLGGGGD
jgi:hypothetical protein